MKPYQWETLKRCAAMEEMQEVPVGLIVDSPWIPGHVNMLTIDYFTMTDKWLDANIKVINDFPEVIFLPGFWVEYGMALEPSAFGCKIEFFENTTPNINHIIASTEDVSKLKVPNPKTDGLMPFVLSIYKNIEPKVKDKGYCIKTVAARGPLTLASHLMGLTNFLIGLKTDPENIHRFIKLTTKTVKEWLEAQADVLSDVEGIMVLDDIVGFLSKEDYLEFAHPYMKEIFEAFPNCIKMYHNDTDNIVFMPYLEDLKVNIFNFTHLRDVCKVRELVGDKVCLLGNVAPLDVLTKGDYNTVKDAAQEIIKSHGKNGLILSAGGGVSPGTPGGNISALIDAAKS